MFRVLPLLIVLFIGLAFKINSSKKSISRGIASYKSSSSTIHEKIRSLSELKSYLEKEALRERIISGSLVKETVEEFDSGYLEESYFVDSEGVREQVNLLRSSDEQLLGKDIRFHGFEREGQFYGLVERVSDQEHKEETEQVVKKMLVLMVEFNDSHAEPYQWPDGRPIVEVETLAQHLNEGAFKRYFDEVTLGKVRNEVLHVEDWHRFDRNADDVLHGGSVNRPCYVTPSELVDLVVAKGIDYREFDNISIISKCYSWKTWGVASSLTFPDGHRVTTALSGIGRFGLHFGSEREYVPGWSHSFLRVFTHERLHNFGVGHSRGLDCGQNQQLFPCSSVTYANPYDVMGGGKSANAHYAHGLKNRGWREEKTNFLHIFKDGVYTLGPFLNQDPSAQIAAYIYSPFSQNKKPVFMVENRTGVGIDADLRRKDYHDVVQGLTLYSSLSTSSDGSNGLSPASPRLGMSEMRIVDTNPDNYLGEYFIDRIRFDAITQKRPYFDLMTGVEINILSQNPRTGEVTFKVGYNDERRVCFKQSIYNQTGNVYAIKEQNFSKKSKFLLTLYPGEKFNFKVDTFLSNPFMCPRDKVMVRIPGARVLMESWAKQKDRSSERKPIPDTITAQFDDYNRNHQVGPGFEVLENPQSGTHSLEVEYINLRSGEKRTSILNIVVAGNTSKK